MQMPNNVVPSERDEYAIQLNGTFTLHELLAIVQEFRYWLRATDAGETINKEKLN